MNVRVILVNLIQRLVFFLDIYLGTDVQKIGFARPMGRN